MRAQSDTEPLLADPRDGDETEVTEKGGEGGATKRALMALFAFDPREGDETETSERGGSTGRIFAAQGDPRPGDETTPIRESPLGPPVRV